jgi:hypothetical protein
MNKFQKGDIIEDKAIMLLGYSPTLHYFIDYRDDYIREVSSTYGDTLSMNVGYYLYTDIFREEINGTL